MKYVFPESIGAGKKESPSPSGAAHVPLVARNTQIIGWAVAWPTNRQNVPRKSERRQEAQQEEEERLRGGRVLRSGVLSAGCVGRMELAIVIERDYFLRYTLHRIDSLLINTSLKCLLIFQLRTNYCCVYQ